MKTIVEIFESLQVVNEAALNNPGIYKNSMVSRQNPNSQLASIRAMKGINGFHDKYVNSNAHKIFGDRIKKVFDIHANTDFELLDSETGERFTIEDATKNTNSIALHNLETGDIYLVQWLFFLNDKSGGNFALVNNEQFTPASGTILKEFVEMKNFNYTPMNAFYNSGEKLTAIDKKNNGKSLDVIVFQTSAGQIFLTTVLSDKAITLFQSSSLNDINKASTYGRCYNLGGRRLASDSAILQRMINDDVIDALKNEDVAKYLSGGKK